MVGTHRGVDRALVQEALEALGRGFRLSDKINMTELRRSAWTKHLEERGKLQLSDRGTTVAVVVTPEVWHSVEALVEAMQNALEEADQREIERMWQGRVTHERKPADSEGLRLLQLLESDESR